MGRNEGLRVVRTRRFPQLLTLRPPPLRFEAGPPLSIGNPGRDALRFTLFELAQSLPEPVQGDDFVAMLTALSSRGNDDSTGLVGQPNAGLSCVLVLPSLAAGSEGVNSALREEVVV